MSEDPNSLSYLYELDENTWLLMIDSCQYSPVNKVGGSVSEATYEWVEQQLEAAWDAGVEIIPVAHHNLLDESEIYVDECTIEHSEPVYRSSGNLGCTIVSERTSACAAL